MKKKFLKQWRFTLILIFSVIAGALLGYFIGPNGTITKNIVILLGQEEEGVTSYAFIN